MSWITSERQNLREQQAETSSDDGDEDGLNLYENQNKSVGESERLQNRKIADSLAYRRCHCVSGDEQ